MGWLPVLMGAVAGIVFYGLHEVIWLAVSAVATISAFWSWGVMHNYGMEDARKRSGFDLRFYDITRSEADSVPNWITMIHFAFSLGCAAVLAAAVVFVF